MKNEKEIDEICRHLLFNMPTGMSDCDAVQWAAEHLNSIGLLK